MSGNGPSPLPAGWSVVRLDECCDIIQGQSPPGHTYNKQSEGLPFFQGKGEFGDIYPSPATWCTLPSKIAQPEDILISIRAPVGPTNLCPSLACIGRGLAAIRPLGAIPSRYVLYALRLDEALLASQGTGSTFGAIKGEQLRAHPIRLAPLAEQERIVAEMEKHFTRLDVAVATLQRARANLKRYRTAVLKAACEGRLVPTEADLARTEGRDYERADALLARILKERRAKWEADQLARIEAARKRPKDDAWKAKYVEPALPETDGLPALPEGWTWATLKSIAELKGGITKGQKRNPSQALRPVPYLRVANVQRGYLDLAEIKLIEATEDEIDELRLQPGDVLFNEGGDRDKLGRGWVWRGEIQECIHQNHVFRARLHGEIAPEFISWYGNSFGQSYFVTEGKQTTNLASINLTKLGGLPVALPPASEQRRMVEEIERHMSIINDLESLFERSLRRAERLRQAVLNIAFAGRLVAQNPSDEAASILLERIRAERASRNALATVKRRSRRSHMAAMASAAQRRLEEVLQQ